VLSYNVSSQTGDLEIKNSDKGFYLEHKVIAKENFYSIGRLYNVHPRFIAAFNSLDMNKGLNLGQVLRIPLTDSNFSQRVNKGTPVYYRAGDKENLGRVGAANKVPVENLRSWNNLSGDNLSSGKKLIVGFLTSGELASLKETEIKTDKPVDVKEDESKVKKDEAKTNTIVKEETKKTEPIYAQVKEEIKTADIEEGFFKSFFNQQIKIKPVSREETVTSGIFKTIYGWRDKKYFMLIDKVEPGTIVKITNPSNNKVVYAKVLYGMEGIRQNLGLDIRISNAAADALGISDTDKFIVKVNF